MRPHMIQNIHKVRTVVLDPGHGGYDKGATSRFGCEKDYTLDVARQLRPLLQAKGLRVVMTREGDYFVPLEVRARIANAAPDAIFVSIHFNAADANPAATGFEIYSLTPQGAPSTHDDFMKANADNSQNGTAVDTHSMELSACIYHSVLGHIGEFDRGIKRARFAVLRLTKIPSVLMESGFLTERGESKLIANKEWRGKLAQAISIGIDNYKSLADRKLAPLLVRDYTRKPADPIPAPDIKLQALETPPPKSVVPPPAATPAPVSVAPPSVALPSPTPIDLTKAMIVP
jgi:N-acetylmuramoyl-L-alanine amidase